MFQNCVSFQKATEMFYSMQYDQGLAVINDCIAKDTNNSILYSNRALFYSQLGYVQQAFSDLNLAIELNHLNYIAYFNMFSLLMRIQKFDAAFQNLCCSLSCLYLIRAKTKKSQLDASKAIKYAQNNMEAHVLKGLIHLENGKYKLALNELDWACEINPRHEIVRNIRTMIFKKMNPGLQIDQTLLQQDLQDQKGEFIRLQSSYTFEDSQKQNELRDKIMEFNQIYNNLNQFQGTVTTKVPKDQQNSNLSRSINIDLQNIQQTTHIENQHEQVHQRGQFESNRQVKSLEETNTINSKIKEDQSSQIDKLNSHQSQQLTTTKPHNHQEVTDQQVILQTLLQSNQSIAPAENFVFDIKSQSVAIMNDDGLATPSSASLAPQPGHYGNSSQDLYLYDQIHLSQHSKSFHSIQDQQNDRFSDFQSMINSHNLGNNCSHNSGNNGSHNSGVSKYEEERKDLEDNFESLINQNSNQSHQLSTISNALYPRPDNAMLQFSILKLQLINISPQQVAQLQNLYCIANYLNIKQATIHSNFKLRTACQKGKGNGTQWNETFDPIEIPENPQCMKIKVYNKKYSSYRDDLIGEMEVEITTHGLVKLPLFNKKGSLSGSLFMNLQLVFPSIQQAHQQDEF